MNKLSPPLLLLVMLGPRLMAQSVDSNTARQEQYALITLTKYCSHVETVSDSQQPRMFAQVASGLGRSSGWAEFESKTEWENAGRPRPIARVWYDDTKVVRVAITTDDGQSYADYCYRPDGSLGQLRSVPAVRTDCDSSLFHCDIIVRGGPRLYPPRGMLAPLAQRNRKQSFPVDSAEDLDLLDFLLFRPLKPEKASISFAPMNWPEYLNVEDLPFNRLLYVSTKNMK